MNRIGRLNIVLKRAPLTRITIRSSTITNSSTIVVKTSKFADNEDNFVANSGRDPSKSRADLSKRRLTTFVSMSSLIGYCVTPVPFDPLIMGLLSSGVYFCSASANSLNQLQETVYDANQPTKQDRVCVVGKLTHSDALTYGFTRGAIGVGILSLINPSTALLGFANILLYGIVYTRSKRRTWWNTQIGAIVGMIPPIMGVTAGLGIDGLFTAECVLTSLILFLWQFTHFYALSTKTWSGYSQAHYHMLPLNSTRWAAIWAFVSWVLVCAIHVYIYNSMEGTKIAGLNAGLSIGDIIGRIPGLNRDEITDLSLFGVPLFGVALFLIRSLFLSSKWLIKSSKGVIDTKLLHRTGF